MDPQPVTDPLGAGTAWCRHCDRLIYRLIGTNYARRWYHRHNASTTCTGSTRKATP